MCGIIGFNWNDRLLLNRMKKSISHRGPDDNGSFIDSFASLGHQRLSIIDLSKKGRQPIFNEDESIAIIFNGEIYNYKEIKTKLEIKKHKFYTETDTEVIVHAYEEYGFDCPKHLNGIFAFAIYDTKKKIFFLARDHLGVKPLYYYSENEKFIFASEIKAILCCDEIKREINKKEVSAYLSLRYVPGPETMLKNIKKILPGHSLIYDIKKNKISTENYYNMTVHPTLDREKARVLLKKQLTKSVEMQLMSDVPLGIFLSGGLDSSAVLALMKKNDHEKIKTFSIGFEDYKEKEYELEYARYIADYFGAEYNEMYISPKSLWSLSKILWYMDEPVSDATAIPTYFLSEFSKKKVTVTLTGEGADEAFGGYVQYKVLEKARKIYPLIPFKKTLPFVVDKIPKEILTKFFDYPSSIGEEGKKRLIDFIGNLDNKTKSYLNLISVFSEKEKKELISDESYNEPMFAEKIKKTYFDKKADFLDQIFIRENKTWLPDYILTRLDKMTMAASIESRVPLLDKDLVELSCKIPRNLKENKNIFRESMKGLLPKKILYRKKYPFTTPVDCWFGKGYKTMLKDEFESKNSIYEFINKEYIKKLLSKKESGLLHSRQLWSLLTLSKWNKIFIEEEKPK